MILRLEPGFHIRPHKDAPVLSNAPDAAKIIQELLDEVQSDSFQTSEPIRMLMREAALVSLWFFLKGVAAAAGPYEAINQELHLDMCNFRQSDYCMSPGARGAGFLPRGHLKSTVFSHGPDGWEILRNPDIRIRLVNAIYQNAQDFMRNVAIMFSANDVMAWLFPERYVFNPRNAKRFNENEIVVPGRSRNFSEPNLMPGAATGASESKHHDLLNIDDLVGLDDLTSERGSSAGMETKRQWFLTNTKSLLASWRTSRIFYTGTRYAVDDVHDEVFSNSKLFVGSEHTSFKINPNGKWVTYYRKAVENGQPIFPEWYDMETFEEMRRDPNQYWTWITQYQNDPQEAGLAEFVSMEVFPAELEENEYGRKMIRKLEVLDEGEYQSVPLGACDVVMAVDPAGTDTGVTAKTSRTAIEVWARDWDDNDYLIWSSVGYYGVQKMFDEIFKGHKLFEGYIRGTAVEAVAMQKILLPLLRREQDARKRLINPIKADAKGDKVARIRNIVGQKLSRNRIWVVKGAGDAFVDEKNVFPQAKYRMDALDAAQIAFTELKKPFAPDEQEEIERAERRFLRLATRNATGY